MIMFPVSALLIAGALAMAAPAALAETTPRPGPHDNRVRVATWTEGQVYRIVTTLTRVTTVEFGEGETIRSAEGCPRLPGRLLTQIELERERRTTR